MEGNGDSLLRMWEDFRKVGEHAGACAESPPEGKARALRMLHPSGGLCNEAGAHPPHQAQTEEGGRGVTAAGVRKLVVRDRFVEGVRAGVDAAQQLLNRLGVGVVLQLEGDTVLEATREEDGAVACCEQAVAPLPADAVESGGVDGSGDRTPDRGGGRVRSKAVGEDGTQRRLQFEGGGSFEGRTDG